VFDDLEAVRTARPELFDAPESPVRAGRAKRR